MLSVSKYQHRICNIEVTYVPVHSVGVVSFSYVISAIRAEFTTLVTLIIDNNESGSLQPMDNITTYYWELQVLFHTDVPHSFGKFPMELRGAR